MFMINAVMISNNNSCGASEHQIHPIPSELPLYLVLLCYWIPESTQRVDFYDPSSAFSRDIKHWTSKYEVYVLGCR